jgi:hypothetical protein
VGVRTWRGVQDATEGASGPSTRDGEGGRRGNERRTCRVNRDRKRADTRGYSKGD